MRYKMTFVWSQGEFDVSESYWTPEMGAAPGIQKIVQNFLDSRVGFMFDNQVVRGLRVSEVGASRVGIFLPPGTFPWPSSANAVSVPDTGKITITQTTRRPDQARVAINMRMSYGNPTLISTRYLSSVPDAVTNYEPFGVRLDGDTTWFLAWKKWRDNLTGIGMGSPAWTIRHKVRTGDSTPVGVSYLVSQSSAPSLLGLAIPVTGAPAWTVGDRVSLTGFRMKSCTCPKLLGSYVVDRRDTELAPDYVIYFLRGSAGLDPDSVKTVGYAALEAYQYSDITGALLVRAGIHQRGNSASRRRGRRSIACCPLS